MEFEIDQDFIDSLPEDKDKKNNPRQVHEACYSWVKPHIPANPQLLIASSEVQDLLGFSDDDVRSKDFLDLVSGRIVPSEIKPYATCYGGHQFGHWAGQLGDGRAINLMHIKSESNSWALQLKGAGPTPYSRGADGFAVLRSSIREFLCSEAMHHLGVPTTRALSLVLSGEKIMRDMLYDGNPELEFGAIVCRVSPSFIRFGQFEIFAARKDYVTLKKLLDFTIEKHFSHLKLRKAGLSPKDLYLDFLQEVVDKTLEMIIHWQRVGFVHGVMNTDNMSILGLTIDYGPYGWLDNFDPDWTPNTTDKTNKRYRFGYQASISLWNLVRLANAIAPLVEDDIAGLEKILSNYQKNYERAYLSMMRSKLGLEIEDSDDQKLIDILAGLMKASEIDMTIFFRNLSQFSKVDGQSIEEYRESIFSAALYGEDGLEPKVHDMWNMWFDRYRNRLRKENLSDVQRLVTMNKSNPKYVLRNYIAQLVIDKSNEGDHSLLHEVHQLLKSPYDEQPEFEKWFAKRPDWARTKVGCSMLSCSS